MSYPNFNFDRGYLSRVYAYPPSQYSSIIQIYNSRNNTLSYIELIKNDSEFVIHHRFSYPYHLLNTSRIYNIEKVMAGMDLEIIYNNKLWDIYMKKNGTMY